MTAPPDWKVHVHQGPNPFSCSTCSRPVGAIVHMVAKARRNRDHMLWGESFTDLDGNHIPHPNDTPAC